MIFKHAFKCNTDFKIKNVLLFREKLTVWVFISCAFSRQPKIKFDRTRICRLTFRQRVTLTLNILHVRISTNPAVTIEKVNLSCGFVFDVKSLHEPFMLGSSPIVPDLNLV